MKFSASAASIFALAGIALSSQPALAQSAAGKPGNGPASVVRGNIFGDGGALANGAAKQEPSKAPLPAGYAYDANGRIGFVGNAGGSASTVKTWDAPAGGWQSSK